MELKTINDSIINKYQHTQIQNFIRTYTHVGIPSTAFVIFYASGVKFMIQKGQNRNIILQNVRNVLSYKSNFVLGFYL